MRSRSSKRLFLAASLVLAAIWSSPLLRADEWYVDAQNGSNASDGQSEATAWRTLTHAIGAIPSQPVAEHTLHVAPGGYDAALGEVYPLRPRPGMRIVGTAGSAATVLDGGGLDLVIYSGTEQVEHGATTGLEGLTLRNGRDGMKVLTGGGDTRPAFRELVIEGMTLAGIYVDILDDSFGGTSATPTGEHLTIQGCVRGVELYVELNAIFVGRAEIELTDTLISGSVFEGLQMRAYGDAFVRARLDRCRVVDNGGDGVYCLASGEPNGARLEARASLIAGNGGCGARGELAVGTESTSFEFEDCTVAGNLLAGVRTENYPTSFRNCVVAGNADDIDMSNGLDASWSCAQDGDFLGFPNCIAADPRFVDAAGGDYRLRFGSPCAETGDPMSAGALDLLGHARPHDGDLDTVAAVDMGAFEHAPLSISGTPGLGQTMTFELWGARGATARLLFAPAPLVDPVPTPYGALRLDRPVVVVLFTTSIPTSPRVFSRRLPADPAFIGTTFSFQTLTSSDAAPAGWALSNPASFVIGP